MSATKAYEEVVDFIAAGSSPASVVAFRPSEEARARVSVLISQEKTVGLDAAEKAELDHYIELDHYMLMEHLIRLAKARARQFLTPRDGTILYLEAINMISLTQETEIRLRERAEREGQNADSFAEALILDALTDDPDDLTEQQITEIRSGIRQGLEAAEAGRVKSLSQAIAEVRQRHGFPDSWASGTDGSA